MTEIIRMYGLPRFEIDLPCTDCKKVKDTGEMFWEYPVKSKDRYGNPSGPHCGCRELEGEASDSTD